MHIQDTSWEMLNHWSAMVVLTSCRRWESVHRTGREIDLDRFAGFAFGFIVVVVLLVTVVFAEVAIHVIAHCYQQRWFLFMSTLQQIHSQMLAFDSLWLFHIALFCFWSYLILYQGVTNVMITHFLKKADFVHFNWRISPHCWSNCMFLLAGRNSEQRQILDGRTERDSTKE